MKTANIKLQLSTLTFTRVLLLLQHVLAQLTGNTFFTTPVIPLADMKDVATDLAVAIEESTDGSRKSRVKRDVLVAKAKQMLTAQGNYVRAISQGDITMLESSGFELSKQPTHHGVPLAPSRLSTSASPIVNEVELRWPRAEAAIGYRVFKTDKDPNTNPEWEYVDFTSRVNFTCTGLESFKPYWFSVTSLGTAGESSLSKPALGRAI